MEIEYSYFKRMVDENIMTTLKSVEVVRVMLMSENLRNPTVDGIIDILAACPAMSPVETLKKLEEFQKTTCCAGNNGANVSVKTESLKTEKLIGVKELAKTLDVNENWIYQRTRLNKIPHIKMGKYIRFDLEKVMEFLKQEQGRIE